jgi:hypothetical protein
MKPILYLLSILYILAAFFIPDAEIYIGNSNSGPSLNVFGLIVGGIASIALIGSLSKGDLENVFGISRSLVLISILNVIFILFDFTANSSGLLSESVAAVKSMGMSVSSKLASGAYINLFISLGALGAAWRLNK